MKIFGHKFGGIKEKLKGFWIKGGITSGQPKKFYPGQFDWKQRCEHYDQFLEGNAYAKSCAWGLAGRVLENGIYLEAVDKYDRAVEALEKCEELNERIGIKTMVYDTIGAWWAPHGSAFWEKTFDPVFDVKIIPNQELMTPLSADSQGEIDSWQLGLFGGNLPKWSKDEIIHFCWMRTSRSYPFGTSLFTGAETELEILEQLEIDIKNHMHRTAFPQTAIGVGDDKTRPTPAEVTDVKTSVDNWQPGETQVTSYPLTSVNLTGDRPIQNLGDVLEFCKDNVTDSFMISPISKLYNSTYASSKEMQAMENARLIAPMQTLIGHVLETEIYKPYLESQGYSIRVCPSVHWADPDAEKPEVADYWQKWVQMGVPLLYAAEQAGLDVDKLAAAIKKDQAEKLERQREFAQFQKVQPNQPQQGQKGEEVWEVRKKKRD